jgi:sugar phosphate isomerase/epimerase
MAKLSRRTFVSLAAAPLIAAGKYPVGLELYSVREDLKKDLDHTVRQVAKMGYEVVEFYSPYFEWTPQKAKEVRKLLDDLNIRCLSTHNEARHFEPEALRHALELNEILGSKYIVMASAGRIETLDGWRTVAETLNRAADELRASGLRPGFHNHKAEFVPIQGIRPMNILAQGTGKEVILQLDVGTCIEAGSDPVAWINEHPGRIHSMHCKDWAPDPKGYKVLLGDGVAPWKKIFQAAEKAGGIEYYLVEQEGSALSPMETVEHCLNEFRRLHG